MEATGCVDTVWYPGEHDTERLNFGAARVFGHL
jgi:hypothetical protein